MTKRKPLSTIVADSLVEKIRAGQLPPGAQLPTEAELCAEYEVSRTVVREAVARLRSEGLLVPHQGRGIFVGEAPAIRNFSIPDEALETLPETIALLELRLSVEVEAAGLCAERRTVAEAAEIRRLMEEFDAQHGDPAAVNIHYDYDFHLAIAKGARNDFIYAFLAYLKPKIVPRYQLGYVVAPAAKERYYARIHKEHNAVVEAIERGDGRAARHAMRRHLFASLERVRELASSSGVAGTGDGGEGAAALMVDEFGRSLNK
jgi:GntR family transcriptional regulator, transcriptional repressor for pyruvate dehydrogenase complex